MSDWSTWSPCLNRWGSMYRLRQRFCFESNRTNCPGVDSRGLIKEEQDVTCANTSCIGNLMLFYSYQKVEGES